MSIGRWCWSCESLARALPGILVLLVGETGRAQTPAFVPGGREIFSLDLKSVAAGALPKNVSLLQGKVALVTKDGVPMIRVNEPTEFLITLPEALPTAFTLEFDIIAKACCNPSDLEFEGTPTINRGPASMHVVWHPATIILAGGGVMQQVPMPDDINALLASQPSTVAASFQGTSFVLYTNGRPVIARPDRQFVRGRVLRVMLGGQPGDAYAVHLSRLRIADAAPTTVSAVPAQTTGTISPVTSVAPPAGARATTLSTVDCPLAKGLAGASTSNTTARLTWQPMGGKCTQAAMLSGATPYGVAAVRWDVANGSPCVTSYEDFERQYTGGWGIPTKYIGDARCTQTIADYRAGALDDAGLEPEHTYKYRAWVVSSVCEQFNRNCQDRADAPQEITIKGLTFGPVNTRTPLNQVLRLAGAVNASMKCNEWYPSECTRTVKYTWSSTAAAASYLLSLDIRPAGYGVFVQVGTIPIPASGTPSYTLEGEVGGAIYACLAIVTDPKNPPDPRKGECILTEVEWP
jgi:hypothetical protein